MNYVYIATSIDGYIATKSGDIEWLHELPNPDNSDYVSILFRKFFLSDLIFGRDKSKFQRKRGFLPVFQEQVKSGS
jgi:hypothetical protein